MFGIGGQELILLMLIGLIVLGPEKLPRIASQIGSWLGQARRMTRVMKRQLEEELDFNDTTIIKPPPSAREPSHQTPSQNNKDDNFTPNVDTDKSSTASPKDKNSADEADESEYPNPEDAQPEEKTESLIKDSSALDVDASTRQSDPQKDRS